MRIFTPRTRHPRRGVMALVVGLSLTALMGAAALVIDLGWVNGVQAELQASSDAAAHGAALQLDGTSKGLTRARDVATLMAATNTAAGRTVTMDPTVRPGYSGVKTGVWKDDTHDFTESADPTKVNAVHVQARFDDLPALFSRVAFERETLAASAQTVAVLRTDGASEVDCFLPLATSSCILDRYGLTEVRMVDLLLNPAGVDNVGWARPAANPNAAWLSRQVSRCTADGALSIGDEIGLGNGADTSVLPDIADAIVTSSTRWDTATWGPIPSRSAASAIPVASYGRTWEGAIPVFDDPSYCDGGGSFNGTQTVAGFAWAAVYDVVTKGAVKNRTIRVRLDTRRDHRVGTEVGGPDYGVSTATVDLTL